MRVIARETRTASRASVCDTCGREISPGEHAERFAWVDGARVYWRRVCCHCADYAEAVADPRNETPAVPSREWLETIEPTTPAARVLRAWMLRGWRGFDRDTALLDAART